MQCNKIGDLYNRKTVKLNGVECSSNEEKVMIRIAFFSVKYIKAEK